MGDNVIETDASTDLWQRQAFADTVFLASQKGMPLSPGSDLGLHHLMQMRIRAQNMSGSKLGRWLGWAQCAVVAAGVGLTLDDMKAINKRCISDAACQTA
ncbi:hypothetical protein BKG82_27085 [Mycobacteroides chelonae]|uniref:Uncharacterized protein n=1 Tax=Mycobacteroides chelonae TaxID=1774 RepID=A0A1S1LHQ0_MYCCH|nr:hypothetical protein [Mycobacteroides chelonae]OHU47319.1 hypothetical protein BKG82_27085 [Mycobacteroides chelonae]